MDAIADILYPEANPEEIQTQLGRSVRLAPKIFQFKPNKTATSEKVLNHPIEFLR